ESGAEKLVGQVDGFLAFPSDGVGLVENVRDAALLFEHGHRHHRLKHDAVTDGWVARAGSLLDHVGNEARRSNPMEEKAWIQFCRVSSKDRESSTCYRSVKLLGHQRNSIEIWTHR